MKTLVIHPKDFTTDFLKPVWSDKTDWTIIQSNSVSKSTLRKNIKMHDKIICLGHGCESGLFGKNRMIIDSTFVDMLRNKTCMFIWCNADVFFKKYKLNGLVSGMIISEGEEAIMCCVPFHMDDITKSNNKLTQVLKESLFFVPEIALNTIKATYLPETNVEIFNSLNFYLYDHTQNTGI